VSDHTIGVHASTPALMHCLVPQADERFWKVHLLSDRLHGKLAPAFAFTIL